MCKGNLWMGTTLSLVYHVHLGVVNCFTMVHFGGLPQNGIDEFIFFFKCLHNNA
jgi:hypothetical protein